MNAKNLILVFLLVGMIIFSSLVLTGCSNLSSENDNLVGQAYLASKVPIKEQVKCVFSDSKNVEACSSAKGSCRGVGSCSVVVSGNTKEQITWKSSCGGYANTVMDGKISYAEFKCGKNVTEQVKCVFSNTAQNQECYSEKGGCTAVVPRYVNCNGSNCSTTASTITCIASVNGKKGEQVTWKSTCGGYAYTTMDGQNDYAQFKCIPDVTESVKCVMWDATSPQECYSDKGSCKGEVQNASDGRTYAACYVENIVGKTGDQVTWKSSCGGYAYTTFDGNNDVAEFKCAKPATCADSDSGLNYYEKGGIKGISEEGVSYVNYDYCISQNDSNYGTLQEYSCSKMGISQVTGYSCPNGCVDGACVNKTIPPTYCNDSDNGLTYYTKGYLSTSVSPGTQFEDYCLNSTSSDQLIERHCLSSNANNFTVQYTCPYGCSNGACMNYSAPKLFCYDSDGLNTTTKGTIYGVSAEGYNYSNTDYCVDSSLLQEYSCTSQNVSQVTGIGCTNGCSNGACIVLNNTDNSYWLTTDVAILNASLNSNGAGFIVLKNNIANGMYLDSIWLTYIDVPLISTSKYLTPGQINVYYFNSTGNYSVGSAQSFNLSISYYNTAISNTTKYYFSGNRLLSIQVV
jgi:hypothetical protein